VSRDGAGVVVIGVGNVLLGDDGAGVRVVETLRALARSDANALPPGTRLVDGGTLGLDLLGQLEGAAGLVLVDAMDTGRTPGTVSVLRGGATGRADGRPGPGRRAGVGQLLAAARALGSLPPHPVLVGIQVADVSVGLELSSEVAAVVADVAGIVCREARALARGGPAPTLALELAGAST
jgi:hydrogenase maturation protease